MSLSPSTVKQWAKSKVSYHLPLEKGMEKVKVPSSSPLVKQGEEEAQGGKRKRKAAKR
jgi:hypothetical protein